MKSRIVSFRKDTSETFMHWFGTSFDDCIEFNSSGTTGLPKTVVHMRSSLWANAIEFNHQVGVDERTNLYHCFPLDYMAGYLNTVLCPLLAGGRVVIGPRFNPVNFWEIPLREGCNTMWLAPTMAEALIRMVRDKQEAKEIGERFRAIFSGTAPLRPDLRQRWLETFGIPLRNSYGTSELLIISVQNSNQAARLEDNCGSPLACRNPECVNGELVLESGVRAVGYRVGGEIIPLPSVEGGKIRTGDLCDLSGGIVRITGRIKDIIIRGGENIDPVRIENCIRDLPGVTDVAVLGKPHSFWGESVSAFVECREYPKDVIGHCSEFLPKSHVPAEVIFVDSFPRTVTGKIKKGELKNRLINASM